jgi:hypothetical protein
MASATPWVAATRAVFEELRRRHETDQAQYTEESLRWLTKYYADATKIVEAYVRAHTRTKGEARRPVGSHRLRAWWRTQGAVGTAGAKGEPSYRAGGTEGGHNGSGAHSAHPRPSSSCPPVRACA